MFTSLVRVANICCDEACDVALHAADADTEALLRAVVPPAFFGALGSSGVQPAWEPRRVDRLDVELALVDGALSALIRHGGAWARLTNDPVGAPLPGAWSSRVRSPTPEEAMRLVAVLMLGVGRVGCFSPLELVPVAGEGRTAVLELLERTNEPLPSPMHPRAQAIFVAVQTYGEATPPVGGYGWTAALIGLLGPLYGIALCGDEAGIFGSPVGWARVVAGA